MTIKLTLILIIAICISSCATILHKDTVKVQIYCDVDSAQVQIKDSNQFYYTPASIELLRSEKNAKLIVSKDSIRKNLKLESSISTAFWLGNFFSGLGFIGMIIDGTNSRMYTYPEINYVSLLESPDTVNNDFFSDDEDIQKEDIEIIPNDIKPTVKNQLNFQYTFPSINQFYINQKDGYGKSTGFFGIGIAFEYYVTNQYSIDIGFSGIIDYPLPLPVSFSENPSDSNSISSLSSALFAGIQLGMDLNTAHIGVGLQVNKSYFNSMETIRLKDSNYDHIKFNRQQINLGLALSGMIRLTNSFNIGLIYYPSVFTWNKGDFDFHYTHLFSFELIFKFEAYRPGEK